MPAVPHRCPSAPAEFDEEGRYERHIQAAFQAASASLLGLLQRELGLRQALTALKQYMLLSQGDMLGAFLDSADEELQKSAVDVSEIRLQSLLDLGEASGCGSCSRGLTGCAWVLSEVQAGCTQIGVQSCCRLGCRAALQIVLEICLQSLLHVEVSTERSEPYGSSCCQCVLGLSKPEVTAFMSSREFFAATWPSVTMRGLQSVADQVALPHPCFASCCVAGLRHQLQDHVPGACVSTCSNQALKPDSLHSCSSAVLQASHPRQLCITSLP